MTFPQYGDRLWIATIGGVEKYTIVRHAPTIRGLCDDGSMVEFSYRDWAKHTLAGCVAPLPGDNLWVVSLTY